ncbi:MAG: hypothetical protein WC384_07555 [Prolixibacteraceae bacterium]|jgi:hypothetical protein
MTEENEKIKTGLAAFAGKVANAIDDLASLEVTTYAGDFSLTYSDVRVVKEGKTDMFKIKSLLNTDKVAMNAELKLIAYSRFEIDSDVSSIVGSKLSEDEKILLEAHTELVKAAQESRKAIFEFAKNLLKLT